MVQARRSSLKSLPPAVPPRQISITFESRWLCGLSPPERTRVINQLANLLMQAAGLVTKERNDELR